MGENAAPELATIARILGRSSVDIIKSGGYKISALEIESVLVDHPMIKECAVVGKPDETWGEKVTAICVLDGELSLKELRDWGKERMATYKVPQELEILDALPRHGRAEGVVACVRGRWNFLVWVGSARAEVAFSCRRRAACITFASTRGARMNCFAP